MTKGVLPSTKPKHPGNPMSGRRERLRAAFYRAVTPQNVDKIARVFIEQAEGGDLKAARFVFEYAIGKPQQEITLTNADALFATEDQQQTLLDILNRGTPTHGLPESNGVCPSGDPGLPDPASHPVPGEALPPDVGGATPP